MTEIGAIIVVPRQAGIGGISVSVYRHCEIGNCYTFRLISGRQHRQSTEMKPIVVVLLGCIELKRKHIHSATHHTIETVFGN